ncbi:MAG: member of Set1p complex, histone methyl transferase [Sclerophora amabilis]|nr:MAG: member of Set1p complex, histone methyl transferase [Sclerophora amabilis]
MSVPPPPPPPRETTAKISDVIGAYRPTKLLRPPKPETSITSLDFDDQGELLLAACDDESLQIYNCREGKQSKTLFSKKYGAHLARFTHNSQSVIYASTKVDDTIRYLSTHDNQFIRYFPGHSRPVTSLSISPGSDTFLSCSLDNTALLWALNTPSPTGKLLLHTPYLSAFDPSASVIAIASATTSSVLLYDLRNYDKAPFATFDLLKTETSFAPSSVGKGQGWTSIEFSNDGKSLLVGTAGSGHYVLDAFNGELKAFCQRAKGPTGRVLAPGYDSSARGPKVLGQGDVCFTPDGRYLIGGSGSENAYVWDCHASPGTDRVLQPQHELECKSRAAVVAYNPRLNLFVTADREVIFWLPE